MSKRILTVPLLILYCGLSNADVYVSSIDLPTYVELESRVAQEGVELEDPEMGMGENYDRLSNANRKTLQKQLYLQQFSYSAGSAYLALVSGNTVRFREGLMALIQKTANISEPYYGVKIAEMAHLAVEAGVALENDRILEAFGEAIDGLDKAKLVEGQTALFRSSYHYATYDADALLSIAKKHSVGDSDDDKFVCGYTNLLLGKLTQNSTSLETAIACFDGALEVAENFSSSGTSPAEFGKTLEVTRQRLAFGRVSMHRADALRQLAFNTDQSDDRRRLINTAAQSAARARSYIELIENPLMWGNAHRLTSEILDLLYVVESVHSSADRIAHLKSRRDRAYELSVMYR